MIVYPADKSRFKKSEALREWLIKKDPEVTEFLPSVKLCKQREEQGRYRNHKDKENDEQKALLIDLMQYSYKEFITIKLPSRAKFDGAMTRNKNLSVSREYYRKIVRSFEEKLRGKCWWKHPIFLHGSLEHGDDGYWHIHFLTPYNKCSFDEIIIALMQVEREYYLDNDSIEIDQINDKEGAIRYILAEIDSSQDENRLSEYWDLKTWFNRKMPVAKQYKYKKTKTLNKKINWLGRIKNKIKALILKPKLIFRKLCLYNSFWGIYI